MEQTHAAGAILEAQRARQFSRLKERTPDPVLSEKFAEAVGAVIAEHASTLPITKDTVSIEREGTAGVLPPSC